MIAVTLHFNLTILLLIVAVILFILAATRFARSWFMAIGLACFAGAFLADRLVS